MDAGLTHKQAYEARQIRDAETANPGIIRRVVDERVAAGQEPTKSAIREVVSAPRREPAWSPDDIMPAAPVRQAPASL